jgi:hypothetical protein
MTRTRDVVRAVAIALTLGIATPPAHAAEVVTEALIGGERTCHLVRGTR